MFAAGLFILLLCLMVAMSRPLAARWPWFGRVAGLGLVLILLSVLRKLWEVMP